MASFFDFSQQQGGATATASAPLKADDLLVIDDSTTPDALASLTSAPAATETANIDIISMTPVAETTVLEETPAKVIAETSPVEAAPAASGISFAPVAGKAYTAPAPKAPSVTPIPEKASQESGSSTKAAAPLSLAASLDEILKKADKDIDVLCETLTKKRRDQGSFVDVKIAEIARLQSEVEELKKDLLIIDDEIGSAREKQKLFRKQVNPDSLVEELSAI